MAKTYVVIKYGKELNTYKTLPAAKKLADTENAEVFCDGEKVYPVEAEEAAEPTVTEDVTPAAAEEVPIEEHPAEFSAVESYTLLSKMNIRKEPSLNARKLGIAEKGTVVEVAAVRNDWLCLTDGTFILYQGGKFARKN